MLNTDVYDHSVKKLELLETHISWVVLTGEFAYKIKKPVNFGFLDFSTLEKRRSFCEQEVRLNSRLAPGIYLKVVPIAGTLDKPIVSGAGKAFEYAVKMLQFPQSAQLDNMLAAGELKAEHMDSFARMTADFHHAAAIADAAMDYGEKDVLYQPVEENFQQIKEHLDTRMYAEKLSVLLKWNKSEFVKLAAVFRQRKRDGCIRECHGDMHLRNLIWLNHQPMAFDCIEFNSHLSWIDVISEVAFLVMDLQSRQQHQLANRFLNHYLEITGDYSGLMLINFYLCYRALVRAKVDALRIEQTDITEVESLKSRAQFELYLELAITYTQCAAPKLIILQGLSAVGKSTLSQQLLDETGMIRIRSDVERKRLFSDISNSTTNETNTGIYSAQASLQTYTKLVNLAEQIITAGFSVIVDATFLKYEQREMFKLLAERIDVPYIILQLTASVKVMKQRIIERKDDVSDAGIAVLEHQLSNWEALHEEEDNVTIHVDTEDLLDINNLKIAIDTLSKKQKAAAR